MIDDSNHRDKGRKYNCTNDLDGDRRKQSLREQEADIGMQKMQTAKLERDQ